MSSYSLRIADAAFDLPSTLPERAVVICATPRSGSNLLSDALQQTGSVGVPMEYLEMDVALPTLMQRWRCDSIAAYFQALRDHRTTSNGVLSIKTHWHQLVRFVRDTTGRADLAASHERLALVLGHLLPPIRYVHITRSERDRQAVSLYIANHTRQYADFGDTSAAGLPPYDFEVIEQLRQSIELWDRSWEGYFRAIGIDPVRVLYEKLASDPGGETERVLSELGIQHSEVKTKPRTRKQGGSRSEPLVEAYRRDRRTRLVARDADDVAEHADE